MRVALNNNPNITNNYAVSFGHRKVPQQINNALKELRKDLKELPDAGKPNNSFVDILKGTNEGKALISVTRKRKNWFLSVLIDCFNGQKTKTTITSGDKTAIDSVLKDSKVKKTLTEFLKENGVILDAG